MNFKYVLASSFGLLGLIASVLGISTFVDQNQASSPASASTSNTDASKENSALCANTSDAFAQDESQVLASEYANSGTAECLFVGCGGII